MLNVQLLIAYLIAAALPLMALYFIRMLDLFNTTRTSMLVVCMLWGAVGAFGLAYIINNATLSLLLSTGIGGFFTVVRFTAPVLEEILKAAILIYLIRQPSFRYFVDGAIYGFCVGIGFAVLENYFYISRNESAALGLSLSRVVSTSMMHAMCSAVVGLALGQLRRSKGGRSNLLPIAGIVLAIIIHVVYNNIVSTTSLSPTLLLLIAVGIGAGGAGVIAFQINATLQEEKRSFTHTLGADDSQIDVSMGEVMSIQRLGSDNTERIFEELRSTLGDENAALVRRLLLTQANIGILKNNLSSGSVGPRLRAAWESEVNTLQDEFQRIRQDVDRSVQSYMQTMFPSEDEGLWMWLQNDLAQSDPTRVHTFDMFMRTSGLATTFTPEQLEALANRLHRIDIFREIALADLENLGRAIETRTFQDGEMLFDQGDTGDAMYLIEAGEIRIYAIDAQGREKHLRTFEAGRVVGDFAVLDGQPRSARARAGGQLTALVLQRGMFQMFIQSRPQVIRALLKVLADKARFTTASVERTVQNASQIAKGNYEALVNTAGTPAEAPPPVPAVRRTGGVPVVASSALRRIAGAALVDVSYTDAEAAETPPGEPRVAAPAAKPAGDPVSVAQAASESTVEPEAENLTELSFSVTESLDQAFARLATSLQTREGGTLSPVLRKLGSGASANPASSPAQT
jgi:RsiW-degrading membrane proteinase PrsW (M82 family)